MKKINLKGITETLSEKELKNVTGGFLGLPSMETGGCKDSACNCYCKSDSNCWGECSKCTRIAGDVKYVCTQN